MKNLAIFYGGKSVEHDISIITAISVMKNLDKNKYNIIPIYINKNEEWIIPKDHLNINIYTKDIIKGKQIAKGCFNCWLILKTHFRMKKIKKIDIAINCMHGLNGEDGTLSGLMQLNNIPIVGSGVLSSAIGMDKVFQKDLFVINNIPCAKYVKVYDQEFMKNCLNVLEKIENILSYPMVVKPANLGSSIGINISKNREELKENIEIALNFDKKIIIEEQISNLREINCSCIGNYNYVETSVLEEPKNWKTFLDFNEKYLEENLNGEKKQIDVSLGENIDNKIKQLAKDVFCLLECCGVVRIDFLINDKTKDIYVNEINTVPGSFAYYLWNQKYSFKELLDKIIELSVDEYKYKNSNKYTYKSNVLKDFVASQKNNKLIK